MNRSPLQVWHEVITPEGVPLGFQVARAGERIGAFVLDFIIQMAAIVLIGIVASLAAEPGHTEWIEAMLLVIFFFLRHFYFIWFEMRWQGSTPGKRVTGIRVMDALGGPLTAEAVVARNVMRDFELFLPLTLILFPRMVWPGAPSWANLVSVLWALVFLFLPLFNRHRLRVGDIVAGTRVVLAPKEVLLPDLGGQEVRRRQLSRYEFSEERLGVYGIYELQVLEDLLRQPKSKHRREALEAVSQRVRKKLKWKGEVADERFLREFYAALRARLERKMLLGKKKRDKYSFLI